MAARVLVETGAVLQEHVQEVLGGDQLLEQEADGLLDRQRLPAVRREDDAVFVLEAEDPLLHGLSPAMPSGPPNRSENTP